MLCGYWYLVVFMMYVCSVIGICLGRLDERDIPSKSGVSIAALL